jgi:GNAT superfamily N-acetyltransferase
MTMDVLDPLAAVRACSPARSLRDRNGRAGRPQGDREDQLALRVGFRSSEEKRAVLEWLEAGLRPGRPGRLAREYPFLLDASSPARHFTLFSEGAPAAHCVLLPRHIALLEGGLSVGFLSLVYTDPTVRGRGHAGRVLRAALHFARESGIGLALLWSEADALYAREGFEPAGRETLLVLDDAIVGRALDELKAAGVNGSQRPDAGRDVAIGPARPEDGEAIEALRSQRAARVVCDASERARRSALPDLDVRVARSDDGRLLGFAMRGRGDDLQEVIHEWGGDLEATLLCCRSLCVERGSGHPLMLLAPAPRTDLSWLCRRAGARVLSRPLAWMRITSASALADDLVGMGLDADWHGLRALEDETSSARRFWPSRSGRRAVTQSELLELLFGAPDSLGANDGRPDALRAAFGSGPVKGLPLPLFVWGLESI